MATLRLRHWSRATYRIFYALYREDDNGARFLIARYATQAEAEAKAAELARGGHKQAYFVE